MSQPIPETAAARKPRHLLKWIVRALLAVVGIVVLALVIAGVLLATGLPQRYLLESQLGKALTADVKANGISILNPFRI
ncbi:MAG: hypothetical protein NTU83_14445, partial [Candidatus Hydrogenedentes bacterium]|nr:hypothetical protein [Candidatus Hydrogenedentota bacterium]